MCSCSIFMVDEGLDNGDILYQKEVNFDDTEESFESSYIKLHDEIVCLFMHMSTEKSVNRSLKIRSLLTWFGTCRIPSAGAVTT